MNICNRINKYIKLLFMILFWILTIAILVIINIAITMAYINLNDNCLTEYKNNNAECYSLIATMIIVQLIFTSFTVLILISGPWFMYQMITSNISYESVDTVV